MSLDLVREQVNVSEIKIVQSAQIIIENDIIVPDSKPDAARIISGDAEAYTTSLKMDANDESILIQGVIRYKLLYQPEDSDSNVKSINISTDFSHRMDVPVEDNDAVNIVKVSVEHVECSISNGRKINAKTILQLNPMVMSQKEQVLINNISDNDDVQILKSNIDINNFIGSTETVYNITDSMEVPSGNPPIRELLRNDIKIINKEYRLTDDKIAVMGELNITTLYIADDQELSVKVMEHAIAFNEFVDLPGINDEADCEIDYEIRDYNFEIVEDDDGEYRIMNGEVEVCANVWANSNKNVDLILDAYGIKSQLKLDKKVINIGEKAFENASQILVKDSISIGDDSPEVQEIINIYSKPIVTDYTVLNDKIEIEGLLSTDIAYLSADDNRNVSCWQTNIPISHTIDIKGIDPSMDCKIDLFTEHLNYSMLSSRDTEVRFVLGAICKLYKNREISIIEKISEVPKDESRKSDNDPSFIIYFVQPMDSYWEIAKRYTTTINEILSINGLGEEDTINSGMQILITRKTE